MHRDRVRFILVLVVLGTAAPFGVHAGPADPPAESVALGSALLRLRAGDLIRVDTAAGHRVEGHVLGPGLKRFDDSDRYGLTLIDSAGEATEVNARSVDRLWVRSDNTKAGAIFLGITGAVIGMVITPISALWACPGGDCDGHTAAVIGGLTGGLVGAGLGAAVGSSVVRWEVRLP